MNIMITGCAGFIGSHAVECFLEAGYKVVGVDCLSYAGSTSNMEAFIDKIKFYQADITDTNSIKEYVRRHSIEWIINFAAETHVDNSINSVEPFIHSNINGVSSLLQICREQKCKLFQISTDEVYGSTVDGTFFETDTLNPRNPYSATKAAAEHLVTSYQNTYGLDYKMVRMSNNFGPRQHKEKFIPTILRSLKKGCKIPIYGDGKNVRDWFYVKDCVQCILQIFENGQDNQVYNLSLQNELENIEVVKNILQIKGLSFEENVSFVTDRMGHDFRYSINNDKLMSLASIQQTDFNDALKTTMDSFDE